MRLSARREAILDLVEERDLHSQAEIVEALEKIGIQATQATISRDLRQLGLVKAPTKRGALRYQLAGAGVQAAPHSEELRRAFESSVLGVAAAAALLVLRTPSGFANAVAVAIDRARISGVIGTLAGDDTILVMLEDGKTAAGVQRSFEAYLES